MIKLYYPHFSEQQISRKFEVLEKLEKDSSAHVLWAHNAEV